MSTIKANTLLHSDGSTTTQPSIPALDQRMAKAWCIVNQAGSQTILGSYNVSSITDHAVGMTYFNFATAMADGNFSAVGSGNSYGNTFVDSHATTRVRVAEMNGANSSYSDALVSIVVFA